jgi:cobalt-zinc-cadmium efflux system protein
MESRLATLPGVVDVHDLHVWTLTSDMDVVTAHLMVRDDVDTHAVLDSGRHLLQSDFAIAHATLQVEPESHRGCADVSW